MQNPQVVNWIQDYASSNRHGSEDSRTGLMLCLIQSNYLSKTIPQLREVSALQTKIGKFFQEIIKCPDEFCPANFNSIKAKGSSLLIFHFGHLK